MQDAIEVARSIVKFATCPDKGDLTNKTFNTFESLLRDKAVVKKV
ncbi:hypothetical protein THF1C08_250047 [Vibrio jasicida]|uniref:Uncharacterized protein n=1 Tax=Vibrio jasicida TaxID=766224 RepID=A0AAU9QLZ1_9VIBR|nr:hypothetical protein THF1C08_250047 [Vibrio jasicida]CAH1592353.1 hypothetical protein THF1A12_250049 [Vibrio jasicida]